MKYRLMKIIRRSILLVFVLYIMMSIAGYFSTLNNTPEIVLSREPPTEEWKTDWLQTTASILVLSTMVSNIVLNYMPFRNSLYFMATGRENFSTKFNLICTICFQVATCSVSIVFPNVSNVLAIFGGIASVNIVYIVPRKFPINSLTFIISYSVLLSETATRGRPADFDEELSCHYLLRHDVPDWLGVEHRNSADDVWLRDESGSLLPTEPIALSSGFCMS